MMWVLVVLAFAELAIAHFLLALWSRRAAFALTIVTLPGAIWLIGVIRSFRRLPVLLDDEQLVMRAGPLKSVTIPMAAVAGLRRDWDKAAIKHPSVLNLALIAYPNVVVDLRHPIALGRRKARHVLAVAHRLDDAAAFSAELTERISARG